MNAATEEADEQQLVTAVDRNAGAVADVNAAIATEEAESMIVDGKEPVSADEQQLVTAVDKIAGAVADVNAAIATEEAQSMSAVSSVQNHSKAVQRTFYLDLLPKCQPNSHIPFMSEQVYTQILQFQLQFPLLDIPG